MMSDDYGPAAAELWRRVTSEYVLDPAETALLAAACRTLDELARIDAELAAAPLLVTGSRGQPVPNGLLEQARAHRKVLDALVRSLALPVGDAVIGERRGTQQAAAAMARHRRSRLRAAREEEVSGGTA